MQILCTFLPAGLAHTRKIALKRKLSELDSGHAEILDYTPSVAALNAPVLDLGRSGVVGHRVELELGLNSSFHGESRVLRQVLQSLATNLALGKHVALEVITNDICGVLGSSREGDLVQTGVPHGEISSFNCCCCWLRRVSLGVL